MCADVRRIALVHATRIMVIVFTVPFLVRLFAHADIPAIQRGAVSIFEVGPDFCLWFVGTCVVGAVLGHMARLPGKYMLGPMIVSALVHMMGWTDYKLPYELVIAAQIVLGAVVGCRFIGLGWRDVGGIVVAGLGSTLILLVLTLAFAFGLGPLTGMGGMSLFLAYSPGGFMEMGLVALAIGIDVAFVAASHLLRITLVGVFAPLAFKLMGIGGAGDHRE